MHNDRSATDGKAKLPGFSIPAEEHTFRVGPLVNLASLLQSLGADPLAVFGKSGFHPDEFTDPDHRMPFIRSSQLLADCVEATACEHLGLLLGQLATPSHMGIVGFLLRAAPTVKTALQAVVENIDLHDEGGTATLEIEAEYSTFGYAIQLPRVVAAEAIYDLAATMLYKIMRTLCGEDWTAATLSLQRREPLDPSVYRRFFQTTLFFNSTECAIRFPSHFLKKKPPAADELLYRYLEQEASELHALQHHELIDELPSALTRGLMTEKFAARHIASAFGMHERTLHRRLRAAGTSFRQELDRARHSVSEQLLGSTSLPVCDIANALGYADSSGFIRAFQRWSGTSPSSWRKHNNLLIQNRLATHRYVSQKGHGAITIQQY